MSTRLISKNRPHGLRIKWTEKYPQFRDPRRYGPTLSPEYAKLAPYTPCFMDTEILSIHHNLSGKFETETKRVIYPNVQMTNLYSRILDIKILCRVSPTALWMIEQEYGGFDEYVMTSPHVVDHVALMYRERIRDEYEKMKLTLREEQVDVLKHYGSAYVEKLRGNAWKMDHIMLKEVDQELNKKREKKIPERFGLI